MSLREFIERREAEIKDIRAKLLAELKELKAAKDAIGLGAPENSMSRESGARSAAKDSGPTIKEMIEAVLSKRNRTGTAEEIMCWIKEDFGRDIARTSLSPQLSRLKRDRKLHLDDGTNTWTLDLLGPEAPKSGVGGQSLSHRKMPGMPDAMSDDDDEDNDTEMLV